ncbi:hypothetical protein Tco_0014346 [Tanacetum coccineum]
MEQVKLAMSDEMDWINPESNTDPTTRFYTDVTNLSYWKYALSLTKYPAVVYDLDSIEEDIDRLFRLNVVEYDEDALLVKHVEGRRCPNGVESYQLKLNLTKPEYCFKGIDEIPSYTMIEKPYRMIYKDTARVKRVMRISEVHKFGDGTIRIISEQLYYMLKRNKIGERRGYLGGRKWAVKEARRSRRMMNEIERILKTRSQLRRLESYVGGRPKVCDLRLFVRLE